MKIYLDNNATTPIHSDVLSEMINWLKDDFGNPSSPHSLGSNARFAIDKSRGIIANKIGAKPENIIFTSCGTESNNLAIKGLIENLSKNIDCIPHIITSATEHKSVLEVCKSLEKDNLAEITYLSANQDGIISIEDILNSIKDNTVLLSIMLANNETGVIQNIKNIVCEVRKKQKIIIHTDAVQAFRKVEIDVEDLGVDMLSISAHKIGGPKGIGALYYRRGIRLKSQIVGGSHEWNLRAGTENVAGIAGFAKAAEIPFAEFAKKESQLIENLENNLFTNLTDITINGNRENRLPNTTNISFRGIEADALVTRLDMLGISLSTGSACSTGATEPSHVLRGMGIKAQDAYSAIRFSVGYQNSEDEIDYVCEKIIKLVNEMRG